MTQAFEGEAASETSTSDYTSPFPLARRMKREREPSGDATVRLLPPAAFYEGPARAYAAPVHVEGDQLAMITVPATSETGGSTPVTLRPSVEWLNPEPQLEQARRRTRTSSRSARRRG